MKTSKPIVKSYLWHLVKITILVVILMIVTKPFSTTIIGFSLEQYYQGLVTYITGAMIAIFLAIFYSSDIRMEVLRKHQQSMTIYYIVLTDLLGIVSTGLLLNDSSGEFTLRSAFVVMTVLALNMTLMVVRLLTVALKTK